MIEPAVTVFHLYFLFKIHLELKDCVISDFEIRLSSIGVYFIGNFWKGVSLVSKIQLFDCNALV